MTALVIVSLGGCRGFGGFGGKTSGLTTQLSGIVCALDSYETVTVCVTRHLFPDRNRHTKYTENPLAM